MFRRIITATPLARGIQPASVSPVTVTQTILRRNYHEKVLDHYSRPRNVGSLPKNDLDVGTGLVGAPACGDVMKLQIRVDPKTNEIVDVKFKTFGCGSAIASSSYLTELVRGMNIDEAVKIKNTQIAKELCLPPVKLHCSMLAEDAIKSAIKDYRSKSRKSTPTIGPEASENAAASASATAAAAAAATSEQIHQAPHM
ncbi:NifU-like N terminal domain-containing protein [Kalaharituber pfeilii]|nr:NifU-like N terminal domain-containing protein [Kalaharituber pfeilii]